MSSADAGRLAVTASLQRLLATRSMRSRNLKGLATDRELLKVGTTMRLVIADRRARRLGRSAARTKGPRYGRATPYAELSGKKVAAQDETKPTFHSLSRTNATERYCSAVPYALLNLSLIHI